LFFLSLLFVCDESLPNPVVRAITPPSTPGGSVVVEGENLSSVLDVVVGDQALARGAYSSSLGTFIADPPTLPSGSHAVTVRGRNCKDADTGLRYTVP
jgi:hypothetical protein